MQVVVTDTKDWMFFTIEAVGAATIGGGNGGHAGGAAGHGTAGGGGGGGVATGIDFTTSNGETFRMSNCSVLQTTGLFKPTPDTGNLIQVKSPACAASRPGNSCPGSPTRRVLWEAQQGKRIVVPCVCSAAHAAHPAYRSAPASITHP